MAHFAAGIAIVVAAGTPVALGASTDEFEWLYVMAHHSNAGVVHIGASTVVSATAETATGIPVPKQLGIAGPGGPGATVAPLRIRGPGAMDNVFIDAVDDGDSVTWFGLFKH